jgi:hypothetical protein
MTPGDLARIEKAPSLPLPRAYCEFMQCSKFAEGFSGTQDFSGDADEVIEINEDLRRNGFFGVQWPHTFLAIGDDASTASCAKFPLGLVP